MACLSSTSLRLSVGRIEKGKGAFSGFHALRVSALLESPRCRCARGILHRVSAGSIAWKSCSSDICHPNTVSRLHSRREGQRTLMHSRYLPWVLPRCGWLSRSCTTFCTLQDVFYVQCRVCRTPHCVGLVRKVDPPTPPQSKTYTCDKIFTCDLSG